MPKENITARKTICDICIDAGLYLRLIGRRQEDKRHNGHENYCNIDQGLGPLEGIFRKSNDDNSYNPNFICTYKEAS